MFCPPGFRRFNELAPLCYEYAREEADAGRFVIESERDPEVDPAKRKDDSFVREMPRPSLYTGAVAIGATRAVDFTIRDNRLDTYLCSPTGTVLRVDGNHFLALCSWVPGARDLEYWRRRNERFQHIDPITGIVTVGEGPVRVAHPTEPLRSTASPAAGAATRAFEGWAVCFPEDRFPDTPEAVRNAHHEYRRYLTELNSEQPLVGRPRKQERAAYVYWALWPDGHQSDPRKLTWGAAANEVSAFIGEPVSVDTLQRAVTKYPKGSKFTAKPHRKT